MPISFLLTGDATENQQGLSREASFEQFGADGNMF